MSESLHADSDEFAGIFSSLRLSVQALERSLDRLDGLQPPTTGHDGLDAACTRLIGSWRPRLAAIIDAVQDARDRAASSHAAYRAADGSAAVRVAALGTSAAADPGA